MKRFIIILTVLLFAFSANAQFKDKAELEENSKANSLGVQPAVTPFSLLDFSRIRWSHSYSVSYFSGGNYSGSAGLYNSQMFYEFSPKLSLAVNVGIAHNPGAIWGDKNNGTSVLPGFLLNYQPSEKLRITVGMQTYRGTNYNNPYTNPYYYRSALQEDFFR